MKWVLVVLITINLLKPTGSFAQITIEVQKEIEFLFSDFNTDSTPGYSIGIVKNNKLIYSNGFGIANFEYLLHNTSETAFNLASVSKRFTAACLALLITENKLSLDDPVSMYIPEIGKFNDVILIKHLVYNTSGLTDYYNLSRDNGLPWSPFHYFTIDEAIEKSLSEDELNFSPGSEWDYVNVNFMLIARIVEQISGLSLAEFSKRYLFDPLKMNNTFVHDDVTAIIPNRAYGYNYRSSESVNSYARYGLLISKEGRFIQQHRNSPHYGGSGIYSSVNDLAKWSIDFLHRQTFPSEFYELMVTTPSFDHNRDNQAFGLYISDYNGRKKIAWDGGDWGFSTELVHFPEQNISIICLSNLGTGRAFDKVNQISDILIKAGKL